MMRKIAEMKAALEGNKKSAHKIKEDEFLDGSVMELMRKKKERSRRR